MDYLALSSLLLFENMENDWQQYETKLYQIFCRDLKSNSLYFHGKEVHIRYQPMEFNKEEAFFHVTCQDYKKSGDRVPDFRRCERIEWIREFIEAADSNSGIEFNGKQYHLKIWPEQVKNDLRYHILCEELRFIVVVAERDRYCLLITAFYFEHDHSLQKKVKKYNDFCKQKTPHN